MTFPPSVAVVSHPRLPPNAETLRAQALAADPRAAECVWQVSEDRAPGPPSAERASANYAEALRMRASAGPGAWHLVVEDDAEMGRGWLGALSEAVDEVRDYLGTPYPFADRFILLGYCHLRVDELGPPVRAEVSVRASTERDLVYRYPGDCALWGTVCVLYPGALSDELADALVSRRSYSLSGRGTPEAHHGAYDEVIGEYCRTHRDPIAIYVVVPNVAQHLGDLSLLHPTQRPRRSPTYVG